MPSVPKGKVSIIGAGTVGSTLALMLSEAGYRIISIISLGGKRGLTLAKAVHCQKVSASIIDTAPESEIIIVAVPDRSTATVAKQLASVKLLRFKRLLVLHTSGVHSSEVLRPLRMKGALTGSLHPVQTFPAGSPLAQRKRSARGIFYGIDGDVKTLPRIEQIVSHLGGKAVVIRPELRPLYHLTCVFASGYLMTVLNAISELAAKLDLKASWTEVFGPLMTASIANTIRHGAKISLTGPIMRGDLPTVGAHLEALENHAPWLLPLYMGAGIETARLARRCDKLSEEDYSAVIDIFTSFIRSLPTKTSAKGKR